MPAAAPTVHGTGSVLPAVTGALPPDPGLGAARAAVVLAAAAATTAAVAAARPRATRGAAGSAAPG